MVLWYGNIRGVHFWQNSNIPIAIGLNNNYRNIWILSEVPTSDITIQKHHTVLPYSKTEDSSSRDNSIILDVISSRTASIDTVWKSVFLINPKSAEWYLCNETPDRQNKTFLRNIISFSFFSILWLFKLK